MNRDELTGIVHEAVTEAMSSSQHITTSATPHPQSATPVAAQGFIDATTDPERAQALLIIPHALLLREDVQAAINTHALNNDFWIASSYIDAAVSTLSAVRTMQGHLPGKIADRLEYQRASLARMASAVGDDVHVFKALYEAKIGIKDSHLFAISEAYRTAWNMITNREKAERDE